MSISWGCRGKPRICKYYPMACVSFSLHSIDVIDCSKITYLSSVNCKLRPAFYLFGRIRGTLVVLEGVGGFFFSFETVSYPDGSNGSPRTWSRRAFIKFLGKFCLHTESKCKEKSQYFANKMWKTQLPQNRRNVGR